MSVFDAFMAFNAVKTMTNKVFQKVCQSRCNGLINVTKYVSNRTGLTVTVADVDGPTVSGYFCLATEAKTSDGLPHTLEHLVFMGSENYPYKGVLDLLANRCMASGTNAWTEQHYTCYTLKTAGYEGFLMMLPIYLDHLFHPLLTDAQYTTEVHHINGEGEDSGVVYCEMQNHESDMSVMTMRALQEAIYPPGCGYAVCTGGRLENLRTSTSNEKVRAFHKRFYHPKNVNVIISGTVDHEKLFASLESVETNLMKKGIVASSPFDKPFTEPIDEFGESKEIVKTCPAEDETKGLVLVGWRGPKAKDLYVSTAMSVLLTYLTDSSVSPLRQEFVEIAEPFCSAISGSSEEYSETLVYLSFEGSIKEKQHLIKRKLFDLLTNLCNDKSKIDMSRMNDILVQAIEKTLSALETRPHESLAFTIISDFLHGDTVEEFDERLNEINAFKKLQKENVDFWIDLIKRYFLHRNHVAVIGVPSARLVEENTKLERERIENQKTRLGAQKLEELRKILEQSIAANEDNQPDDEVLEKCIVHSTSSIKFLNLTHFSNVNSNAPFPLGAVPFNAMLDDCLTNFLNLSMQLDTSRLSDRQKILLPLWTSLIFESPVLRDGSLIPYEEVVKEYNRDLVSCKIALGIGDSFVRVVRLSLKVDQSKQDHGVKWLKEFLYSVRFREDRIRVVAQRLQNSAAQQKRDADRVSAALLTFLIYEDASIRRLDSILCAEQSMTNILRELNENPKKLIEELTQLNRIVTDPSRVTLYVTCSLEKVKNSSISLENILDDQWKKANLTPGNNFLRENEPNFLKPSSEFGRGAIIAVGSCESCYVLQAMPLILKRKDADYAKLKVLVQYLSMCEGPLWRMVRGRGIAYTCDIQADGDDGVLMFEIGRSSHPVQCFVESKTVVESLFNGEDGIDEDEFDAAKRSLMFDVIEQESTVHAASYQTLLSYYRGVEKDYNRKLLESIWNVEIADLPDVCRKYVMPLFDFKAASTSVTCHPSKLDEVVSGFKGLGCELIVKKIDDQF